MKKPVSFYCNLKNRSEVLGEDSSSGEVGKIEFLRATAGREFREYKPPFKKSQADKLFCLHHHVERRYHH